MTLLITYLALFYELYQPPEQPGDHIYAHCEKYHP